MKISDIKLIQRYLKNEGFYGGEIDGKKGAKTDSAVSEALAGRLSSLPEDWKEWSANRKAVAYLQLLCREHAIDAGAIDGYFGPQTESAAAMLKTLEATGTLPRGFGDIVPVRTNPYGFPVETYEELVAYYGEPCEARTVKVPCPWELRLDWDLESRAHSISIHEKLADSLAHILESAFELYGPENIRKHGLDRYGGSVNCRKKRGSTAAWSTHAWGIAVDWFPSRNKLAWDSTRADLAHPDLDPWWTLWENEGWLSLGRSENRDWMHVQAAKR